MMNWKNKFKLTPLVVVFVLIPVVIVLSVLIFLFFLWWSEMDRAEFLASNEITADYFLREFAFVGSGKIDSLLVGSETMVCLIGSLNDILVLSELNSSQKDSIRDFVRHNDYMSWYLIYLTPSNVSRVFVIYRNSITGMVYGSSNGVGCVNRGARFDVALLQGRGGNKYYQINFIGN